MNQKIVNLRALAILFIVFGHSVIIYDHTFDLLTSNVEMPLFELVKHWISFIQLKLFFSISGFLFCYKVMKWREKSNKEIADYFLPFFQNKVARLLVPYLCVAILWMDPIKIVLGVPDYTLSKELLLQQLQFSNCGHLWFLPCLFLIFVGMFPVFALIRNSRVMHILLLFTLLGLNYLHGSISESFQLQQVAYYLFYFYFGYLINYTIQLVKDIALLPSSRYYDNRPMRTISVAFFFAITLLIGQIINHYTSIGYEVYLAVVILLMLYYYMPTSSNKLINEISNRSYGIYLFHSPLIYITAFCCPNTNPWLMLFLNFIVFGIIAYGMTMVISHTRLKFITGA